MTNETNVIPTQVIIRKLGKPGCRPCAVISAVLAEESDELAQLGVTVVEHDINAEPEILAKYDTSLKPITGVPVLIFERNGHEMGRINGICHIDEIWDAIEHAKTAK